MLVGMSGLLISLLILLIAAFIVNQIVIWIARLVCYFKKDV